MKKLLFIIALGTSIITMGCANSENDQTEKQTTTIKDVDVNEFSTLLATEQGQVLDVRTPEEWAEGAIKGAIKINFYEDDFDVQISKLDKSKPVYVYCKSGGRSSNAANKLQKQGYSVYNLLGGITAWNKAGKPTGK